MTATTPRVLALGIIDDVLRRRLAFDVVLENALSSTSLDQRDRAFVRMLTATVLRRLGQIDTLIESCLDKPLPPRGELARQIMRLGVAQLMFMDVSAHAAIDATVDLARGKSGQPYRKLVNAVLRRLQREGDAQLKAQDAERLNTPEWLWDTWVSAYGEETTRAIAHAHLSPPPLDLTVKSDPQAWAEQLGGVVVPTGSVRLQAAGRVTDLNGYEDGEWWVQDAAAAIPARLLGDVSDKTVVDLCAAPGGKTAQLAQAGAHVIALDRSKPRLARLDQNLDRLGLKAEVHVADAADWTPDTPPDAVLLDAPCSSTGTIRRHPDVAFSKTPQDVAKLTATQDRLLDAAFAMLKPGGVLVYCICSLQPAEGEDRITAFLARTEDALRMPVTEDEVGGMANLISTDGDVRTLPSHLGQLRGMDGFYASRVQKVPS